MDRISQIFLFNAQKIVLVNAVYKLSLSLSVPEIFELKLESCRKSHRFLHVFLPSQILRGAVPPKVVLALTPPPRGTSSAKVSSSYTPNSEVISANLLHFKPIFDPPLKKVVGGLPSPVGGALVRLGHSLARVKIWGRSTPSGPKYVLPKYPL